MKAIIIEPDRAQKGGDCAVPARIYVLGPAYGLGMIDCPSLTLRVTYDG